MKVLCWHGKGDIRCNSVDDPAIEDDRDVIIKVTSCAICGSDLHLMNGYMPTMESGDVLGHETMGEVVEVGKGHAKFKVGDRVVVPFNMACGECHFCQRELFSLCDRSNRNADKAIEAMGHSPSGLFGYSHMLGGYAGGQAEYLRVPFADFGPIKVPDGMETIRSSSCRTSSPTGWMAAENVGIEEGDTVAICGCGPVGQFAIQSAWMMDAGRVIAIDQVPEWCIQRRASCDHRRRGCDLRHRSGSAAAEERKDLETVGCTVEPVKSDVCFPAKGQLHRTALLEAHSRHTGPQHCLLR